jgi:hypothetical protein
MDLEPTTSGAKRPRTKAVGTVVAPKPKRKTLTAARKKPSAVSPVPASAQPQPPLLDLKLDLNAAIATSAFYLAAERGFAPGHELDDWLEAERRVLGQQSS